jgi:predicted NBD/HSP70 family sugar kinase
MKFLGTNYKTAAVWNRGLAIRLLRRHGTLSRHDISRMTQLQGSTLSYIVRELLEKKLVRVAGKRESAQVGQKQVLLTLNPEMGWMLGVSLRPDVATMVLLDSAGGRIDGMQTPISGPIETFPGQLHQALDSWLQRRGKPRGKMLGLGVAVPAVVDADAGVVLRSIPLSAVNVPFQQMLASEFDVTTVIDHDPCYGACSEATDGAAADVSHFVYFSLNVTGSTPETVRLGAYGSALYLQGQIYRGGFYGAGELSGPLAVTAVLSRSDIEALADADGPMPPGLVELAVRVAASLGPIVNFVDVQMVVLAGTARITNRRFIAAVQAGVTEQLIAIPGRAVRVVRSAFGLEASARGAAIAAFDAIIAQGQLFGDTDQRKTIRIPREQVVTV